MTNITLTDAGRPGAGPLPPKRMIAVGALCTTTIFRVAQIPSPPAKVLASDMVQVVDGMALSAACAFQRLGGQAQAWARIGDDAVGHAAREALREEGLDVSGLHVVPGARGSLATVMVDASGERLVVPFHDPQADPGAGWLPLAQLAQADLVHGDVRWPEGARVAMQAALAADVPTMLDGEVAAPGVLEHLLPLAQYAVFSDAGLRAFTGSSDIEHGLRQVLAMATQLPRRRILQRHVGASCGKDGYVWLAHGRLLHVPAPRVEVVDTLAAGDVFHGAFALALLEGLDIAGAARFACAAASLKCTRFGGRLGCPTRAQVDAFMTADASS